jgi:hypothetical protein
MTGRGYNPIYKGRTDEQRNNLYDQLEAESVMYHIGAGQPGFDAAAAEVWPMIDDVIETITETAENAETHYSGMGA